MSDTSWDSVNNLGTVTMVGGSDYTLIFNCVDNNGAVINITGSTCSFKLSPYGQSTIVSLSKSGVITSAVDGIWKVVFLPADTVSLYGVYSFQASILDFSGTLFTPGQGILNIINKIS